MKTVKKIFLDDIVNLSKNFFALVIAIGVCLLPALYAWFNIYSNWDPYGNTGALKLAAISVDRGYTDDNGEYHNQGDTIIDNLKENTSVDWQFVETEDEAIEGVYSGEYYAAVVISEDFTYNMYNVFADDAQSPTLIFYENQKKNPVATKISDTVVSTLQNSINEAFIEVVISEVLSGAGTEYEEIDEEEGAEGIVENLKNLHEDLTAYENSINQIIAADEALKTNLGLAEEDSQELTTLTTQSANDLGTVSSEVSKTKTTLNSYTSDVNATINDMQNQLTTVETVLARGTLANDAGTVETALAAVAGDLIALNSSSMDPTAVLVINMLINQGLTNNTTASIQTVENALRVLIRDLNNQIEDIQNQINSEVVPQTNQAMDDLEQTVENATTVMTSLSQTFGYTTTMLDSVQGSLDAANTSLEETRNALSYINGRLEETIEQVDSVGLDEKMEAIINNLSSNSEAYGKFFSEPVEIETEAVYPIENYGSAVAPFYTTLAVWVGALILTAIIKVHPDKKKYPDATDVQLFFGRYALFWVMAQFQAVVIVLGDIFIFGIQCLHPWWFMLATSIAATTFSLIIYSLVITWGDIGKALSVVIVVLQIAGSSGTYPIELLPEFFQRVYLFFPFPYSINAMRECICGFYEMDYLFYLLELSIFIIVSLVVGLLLKIPFEEINHYMEERMEDTKMM